MNTPFNGVLVYDYNKGGMTCKELYDVFHEGTLLFFRRSTETGTYVSLISIAFYNTATNTYIFTENFYSSTGGATVKVRYEGAADAQPAPVA